MNRAQLKELVKNIMSEESEYQTFFQKALEKAGKSIPSMSDDEKKAFFNKIDSTWDGKGEKNEGNAFGAAVTAAKKAGEDKFEVGGETYKVEEELVGGQKKLDVDGDGEIESSDLADLRAGKKADEAMELPKATIPSAVKSKLDMAIDKIKNSDLTYNQKVQVVGQVMDSLGIDKAEFTKMTSKLKGTIESVNEATLEKGTKLRYDKNTFVVDYVVDKKYTGRDGFPKYILKVVKSNYPNKIKVGSTEEYDDSRLTGLIRNKVMTFVKNESVNEGSHGMATKLLQSIVSGDSSKAEGTKMSKELAQHYIDWIRTSPFGKKNGNLPLDMLVKASFNWGIERGLDSKLKGELSKLKSTIKESLSPEVAKHMGSIHKGFKKVEDDGVMVYDSPTNAKKAADFLNSKKIAASSDGKFVYLESIVKEGVSPKEMDAIKSAVQAASSFMGVGAELKKLGMKYTFATEPLPIYIIQPTPNNKVAIVNKKYATKPDFVVGDIAVGIMESKSSKSVNEGRAFINAARKAKTEGLTEFEFNGKKYPVTIKD